MKNEEHISQQDAMQSDVLKELQKKAAFFTQKVEPDLPFRIMMVMENMRNALKLRQKDFAPLLGVTMNAYNLALSEKRMMTNVLIFIRFCYIFGYDFEQLVFSDLANRRDAAIHKLAILLGNLPEDLIGEFCDSLASDPRVGGREAVALKKAFKNYKDIKTETIKACTTSPGTGDPVADVIADSDVVEVVDFTDSVDGPRLE